MEKSMQSLVAKSSSLYAPTPADDAPRARLEDGSSGRRRAAPRRHTLESAPAPTAAPLHSLSPAISAPLPPAALYSSPFAGAPPLEEEDEGQLPDTDGRRRSIGAVPPQRHSLTAAACQRSASMPMASMALAMSSSLFAASPAASVELSPSLTPASSASTGSGQLPSVSELKATTESAPSQREPSSIYNSPEIYSSLTAPAMVEPSRPRSATASGCNLGSGSKRRPLRRPSACDAALPPRLAAPQQLAPDDLYSSFLLLSEATMAAAEAERPVQAPPVQSAPAADEDHNPFAAAAARQDADVVA